MNVKVLAVLLFWPLTLQAQGFAGLGTDADGFAIPQQPAEFTFPADHGAHPEYRIEWWYITANLTDTEGTAYGLQWTLFRSALAPEERSGWQSPQIWFAHAAVTTPNTHFAAERFARGGIGVAGVEPDPFRAWIDEWALEGQNFDDMSLRAQGTEFSYDMHLRARGPLVFHGSDGYSVKSNGGQASYYYSQPFFEIEGRMSLPDGDLNVTGTAWLDREWSSQPLSENQSGWDWFSLSFDTGEKLMGFMLREREGARFSAATWIEPDGTATAYPDGAFRAEPKRKSNVEERSIPTEWHISLPDRGLKAEVQALNAQAWMPLTVSYWEGPVTVTGSHSGVGYLEMTGYE